MGPPPTPSTSVYVTPLRNGAELLVRRARPGSAIDHALPGSAARSGVRFTRLGLSVGRDVPVLDLDAAVESTPPSGTPSLDRGRAVSYFDVTDRRGDESAVDRATIRFRVENDSLPPGTSAADVRLYRYHDGRWRALETTRSGDGEFAATSSGLSTFAVGLAPTAAENGTTAAPTGTPGTETRSPGNASGGTAGGSGAETPGGSAAGTATLAPTPGASSPASPGGSSGGPFAEGWTLPTIVGVAVILSAGFGWSLLRSD